MRYLAIYLSCLLLTGCPNGSDSNIERSSYPDFGNDTQLTVRFVRTCDEICQQAYD
ncbi:exported protein of unknown function [Moritella yayanosii]|uniref:Lipoprotein n=1 Tax=Moritella yayanosii TaxID=69539 RepID=A0A330LIS3_9GAMM|nr:exported protein of unknown function [Moritella yayanosii]